MRRRDFLAVSVVGTLTAPILPACGRVEAGSAASGSIAGRTEAAYRIGYSGFAFQNEVEAGIELLARFGFHGIEPFRSHLMPYLDEPLVLREKLDAAGLSMVTVSNGGPNMSTNFIDSTRTDATIEDHVAFARDFISVFGCDVFKINLGSRPEGGPSDAHLTTMANTLTELGRRTADLGMRLAPHPHIWSPLERPDEIARVVELTDPEFVSFTLDTAHLTLGGSDPVSFFADHHDRVAHLHFKDTPFKYRGHTGPTPTREEHAEHNLYTGMGSGGVDFLGMMRIMEDRGYAGWITLDYDPPRDHEGTIEQQLAHNKRYVTELLGVSL